jgi:hypothetical protein
LTPISFDRLSICSIFPLSFLPLLYFPVFPLFISSLLSSFHSFFLSATAVHNRNKEGELDQISSVNMFEFRGRQRDDAERNKAGANRQNKCDFIRPCLTSA